MAQGTLAEAAEAMEARVLTGNPEARWSGALLDSRSVQGGELFFALAGEQTDGHLYVADALGRGAAAAVVERSPEPANELPGALLQVPDAFAALHDLTRAVRERLPRRLVAVTGSAGKTTTKELLAKMLGRRFRVAASVGNLNNLYGFPLSLLAAAEDTEWMVAEMGMSTPGELGRISRLGRPDVAVFTNVRPAHLENFGELRRITDAKAELLEGLVEGGLVIANADDPEVVVIAGRHSGPVVWFGIREGADHTATAIESLPGGGNRFVWRLPQTGTEVPIELPIFGRHNVENFLAAAACANALGVAPEDVAAAVGDMTAAPHRGVMHRPADRYTLIDESYNSNPAALTSALESAAELPGDRRWAVLGSMLELGADTPQFHRTAGTHAAELGYDPVWAVGEDARELATAAEAGGVSARWFADAGAAAHAAVTEVRDGDVVLIKGSRGIGLEVVVEALAKPEDAKLEGDD